MRIVSSESNLLYYVLHDNERNRDVERRVVMLTKESLQ